MPQSLYSKSYNSDLPNLEIKTYKRKLRIYCGLLFSVIVILLIVLIIVLLYWFGIINPQFTKSLNQFVHSKCGQLEGSINNGIIEFIGIPYALPPIGDRKFSHAQEIIDDKGCKEVFPDLSPYRAKFFKPQCLQFDLNSEKLSGDENCLFLNVFTPANYLEKKFPVVFVVGGLFYSFGNSGMLGYRVTPDLVKSTDAIHVTVNYRLGPLNSFVDPETNKTNHGLSDLLIALTWIHKNIAYFGGDPSNVVLYGFGSGSSMVLALYNSNQAANLFSKIWISSPGVVVTTTLAEALAKQTKYVTSEKKMEIIREKLKMDVLFANWTWKNVSKFFQKSWFNLVVKDEEIVDNSSYSFMVLDNYFITNETLLKLPLTHRSIPMVIANNANDIDVYPLAVTIKFWEPEYSDAFLSGKIRQYSNESVDYLSRQISKFYSQYKMATAEDSYTRAITDIRVTCPLNAFIKEILFSTNIHPIYRFILDDRHRNFDFFDLKHFTEFAAYSWDSFLYFQGYKSHPRYGFFGDKEIAMSRLLNQMMNEFAWNNEIKDMEVSSDGYVRMNLVRNGVNKRDCFLKFHECNFWEKQLGNIREFALKI